MPTFTVPEFMDAYLNTDGELVRGFRADEEAIIFRLYPDGSLVPSEYYGERD